MRVKGREVYAYRSRCVRERVHISRQRNERSTRSPCLEQPRARSGIRGPLRSPHGCGHCREGDSRRLHRPHRKWRNTLTSNCGRRASAAAADVQSQGAIAITTPAPLCCGAAAAHAAARCV